MPLQKIQFKSGVNRENTRYTTEGGWYECDKIRFRQGTPEKIGGWAKISSSSFLGICRSLWNWVTLGAQNLIGVGTNLKFYISNGGDYFDVTPLRVTRTLGANPFTTNTATNTGTTTTVTVSDSVGGYLNNDFVTLTNVTAVAGLTIDGEYQITALGTNATSYTITVTGTASSSTSGGGSGVIAQYQVNTGPAIASPLSGWGASTWGLGAWGVGVTSSDTLRLWSQINFGQDLIFGPRGGQFYYWYANIGYIKSSVSITIASPAVATSTVVINEGDVISFTTTGELPTGLAVGTLYYAKNVSGTTFNLSATFGGAAIVTSGTQSGSHSISQRSVPLTALPNSSSCPVIQNGLTVSDVSRYVFAFGCNDVGSTSLDPMLIRWSNKGDPANWQITNAVDASGNRVSDAGSIRLSHGSQIIANMQVRQEILVWTDSSLYSLQFLGAPFIWGSQLLADSLSIASSNAAALASGVAYWMGVDKFYVYDGSVKTLSCDLRRYIFEDINLSQFDQIFASTNEQFNEVWWFYCSSGSTLINRYVVYNYLENCWYYGTMGRTAWLDSGLRNYPIAATYSNNLVDHEYGLNDGELVADSPINAYIQSAQFDLGDGHNFAFIWRMLPDLTFSGSTTSSPSLTMSLYTLKNSGSGYNNPASVGGSNSAQITGTAIVPVDQYTGQVYTRVRGRQMALKVESNQLDMTWQLGSPRIDIRPDGKR
jgi:hypothetical protein